MNHGPLVEQSLPSVQPRWLCFFFSGYVFKIREATSYIQERFWGECVPGKSLFPGLWSFGASPSERMTSSSPRPSLTGFLAPPFPSHLLTLYPAPLPSSSPLPIPRFIQFFVRPLSVLFLQWPVSVLYCSLSHSVSPRPAGIERLEPKYSPILPHASVAAVA